MDNPRFELIEEIGSGGMAIVYKAIQHPGNGIFAIKKLHPEMAKDKYFRDIFEREAKFSKRLSRHPNIVKIHATCEIDGCPSIVMDYIESITLEELINRRGRLDMSTSIRIAGQIADALDYAHRRRIVHRDVKPQNILIDQNGNALITDFGISLALSTQDYGGLTMGTPEYMPPEQFDGAPADQRSDVYALGMVMYKMITGRLPYSSDRIDVIRDEKMNLGTPSVRKYLPGIHPHAEYFIKKALKQDVRHRFIRTSDFIRELSILLSILEERIPPKNPPTNRKPDGIKGLFWGIIIIIIVLIIILLLS